MSEINPATAIDINEPRVATTVRPVASRAAATQTTGLHGHPLAANMARVTVAEAVGTFMLVTAIISVAITATLGRPFAGAPYGSIAIPLAGGVMLAVVAASMGHVSGAHLNPAVTLGLAVNRRFPWKYVPAYLIAQFAGAFAAAAMAWGFYGNTARNKAFLGATLPGTGVGTWRTFGVEAVGTFILVLVIVSVATDARVARGLAAVAIGAALAAAMLIGGPLTGAGYNPARTIGPMVLSLKFSDWWVYVAAPIAGGVFAVTLYDRILRPGNAP
jgi:aquaporin Z/aquaporin NIP